MNDIFKPIQMTKKDLMRALERLPDHAVIYYGTDTMNSLGKIDVETMGCDSAKGDCPGLILFKRGSYKWAAKMVFKPDAQDESLAEQLAKEKIERHIYDIQHQVSKLVTKILIEEK